jgi:hypothetical protein
MNRVICITLLSTTICRLVQYLNSLLQFLTLLPEFKTLTKTTVLHSRNNPRYCSELISAHALALSLDAVEERRCKISLCSTW